MKVHRVSGWCAIAVSVVLLGVVLVRPVGLNAANGWTIALGLIGGGVAARASTRREVLISIALLVLAAVPAMFGGTGLLFVPSIVVLTGEALAPRDAGFSGRLPTS
jgi:hypothetical protein